MEIKPDLNVIIANMSEYIKLMAKRIKELEATQIDPGKCVCWYDGCACKFRDKDGGCNC